jgi:hypothetical protein
MIDRLFRDMSTDGYAHWAIHARVRRMPQDISISVPHELADAHTFLRTMVKPLLSLSDEPLLSQETTPIRVLQAVQKTRFQSVLAAILDQCLIQNDEALIGIAVSLRDYNICTPTERNQIALPTFRAAEIRKLCQTRKDEWKSAIVSAALKNREDSLPVLARIARLSERPRLKAYDNIPVNKCDLVVSYWGDIHQTFLEVVERNLAPLDFAVSASHGPKSICTVWSVGAQTFARISTGSQQVWHSPLYKMEVDLA